LLSSNGFATILLLILALLSRKEDVTLMFFVTPRRHYWAPQHKGKVPWEEIQTGHLILRVIGGDTGEIIIIIFDIFNRVLINDYSSPTFDRKQEIKYSKQCLKKKLSYSNVSPKE